MVLCWLRYGMGLCGAALFYVLFPGWLGGYVLVLTLLLPLFSLALSLPTALLLQGEVLLPPEGGRRGAPCPVRVHLKAPWGLPLSRVAFQLEYQNLFSGQKGRESHSFPLAGGEEWVESAFTSRSFGVVQCRLRYFRGYDLLGLFPIFSRKGGEGTVLCRPAKAEGLGMRGQDAGGEGEEGKSPTGGEVRPYKPGDSLRSIHWKNSARLQTLLVRSEGGGRAGAVVAFDLRGTPEGLQNKLDRAFGLLTELLGQEIACLAMVRQGGGEVNRFPVENKEDLQKLFWTLGEKKPAPAPQEAESPFEVPEGLSFWLGDEEEGEVQP